MWHSMHCLNVPKGEGVLGERDILDEKIEPLQIKQSLPDLSFMVVFSLCTIPWGLAGILTSTKTQFHYDVCH